jgi:hypothetical protein
VPDGPSTSAQQSDPTRTPRRLTPREFRKRLFERARTRYGVELNGAWLHDLIKDGLIQGADREGNKGLQPIYTYGYRALSLSS